MAIKTIDLDSYSTIEVEGTTVEIKCLTNGQMQKVSQEFDAADNNIDAKMAVFAPYVRIEGVAPEDTLKFLMSISSFQSQKLIMEAIFAQNRLIPVEAGNSGSLSDGSKSSGPARESSTIQSSAQTDAAESAGPSKTLSLSPSAINH